MVSNDQWLRHFGLSYGESQKETKQHPQNILDVKDDGLKGEMCICQSGCPNGCVQVCFEHLHVNVLPMCLSSCCCHYNPKLALSLSCYQ